VQDDIRQEIDGERQVLVEHLDVVRGVFLGRERVELTADRVNRLGDVLGRPCIRALEEHVLDEVRDARPIVGLVSRTACEPDTNSDRTDMGHRLGNETKTVVQDLADNHLN
jgi:hypothetical protein